MKPELLLDVKNAVGECPTWCVKEQVLYWEDILAPALFRWDPKTNEVRRWDMPETIGSFGLREQGGLIVALRTGVYLFDPETEALTLFANPEPNKPENRLNDGKVGPDGRFWVGSMHDVPVGPQTRPTGALYCIEPDGSVRKMLEGILCSNGLAWSPDGRTMYFSDSRAPYIKAFDYDVETGELSNERMLAQPAEAVGRPDGATVDAEGYYWSAGVSAGCLNRFSPSGELVEVLPVPTPSPTMPCFGGEDLKTLFITSHRQSDAQPDDESAATAGGVFTLKMPVAGVKTSYFLG